MELELGQYQLEVATDFGPRVTSLRIDGGPEILAQLGPETSVDFPGGTFFFRGGHRLWVAPENPPVTYASDDHPVSINAGADHVAVTAGADSAGIGKELQLTVEDEFLVVDHFMTSNDGGYLAPWAITQLPLGGTAILPLVGEGGGVSADRYLVMWPYSSLADARVTIGEDAMVLSAYDGPPLKFGTGPSPRRLGYLRDGFVFIKEIEPANGRVVPDFGAVGQVYVGQGFCELESVGAMADLSSGGEAVLRERWVVVECSDLDSAVRLTVGA